MSLIFAETCFAGTCFFAGSKMARKEVTIRYVTYGLLNLKEIAANFLSRFPLVIHLNRFQC